jgi:ankyrin repeat protein
MGSCISTLKQPSQDPLEVILLLLGTSGYEAEAERVARLSKQLRMSNLWLGISRYQFPRTLRTRLMYAAETGNMERLKFLIDNGSNVNQQDKHGHSALFLAAWENRFDIVRLLHAEGADLHLSTVGCFGASALISASRSNHSTMVHLLCELGAAVDQVSAGSTTALWEAARHGHCDVARILIHFGAALDYCTINKRSPLSAASYQGHYHVVHLLIANGAALNLQDYTGQSALMLAIAEGHIDVVYMLCNARALTNLQSEFGETAIRIAGERLQIAFNNEDEINYNKYLTIVTIVSK